MKRLLFFILFCVLFTTQSFAQTQLDKGDLVVVGVNINASCINSGLSSGRPQSLLDEIYLVSLVDLTPGTTIDLTDNGYYRMYPDNFAGTEGMLRFSLKAGQFINKGEIFSFKIVSNLGGVAEYPVNLNTLNPKWDVFNKNTSFMNFDITSGDQFFIMNNGDWGRSTNSGNHNYLYSGKLLFGLNLKFDWRRNADSTTDSELPGRELSDADSNGKNLRRYHLTTNLGFNYYKGPKTPTSKNQWLIRVLNPNNWVNYNCNDFINNFDHSDFVILDVLQEMDACITENFVLNVENDILPTLPINNSIQKSFEWFRTTTPTNEGGTSIGTGRTLTHTENTAGIYYYYCKITYELKWSNNGTPDNSTNNVNSEYIKVTVNQTQTSPIERIL